MIEIKVTVSENCVKAVAIQRGKSTLREKQKANYILSIIDVWSGGGYVSERFEKTVIGIATHNEKTKPARYKTRSPRQGQT